MATKIIDFYSLYADCDQDKARFYQEHEETQDEREKAKRLYDKLRSFTEKVRKINEEQLRKTKEGRIKYRNGIGYISMHQDNNDDITVIHYGDSEEEAYWNALIDLEYHISGEYEWTNRKQLEEDYKRRFPDHPDGKYIYHGAFFFAEAALQDLQEVYGEKIPQEVLRYYENYASKIEFMTLKYDFKSKGFVKQKKRLEND